MIRNALRQLTTRNNLPLTVALLIWIILISYAVTYFAGLPSMATVPDNVRAQSDNLWHRPIKLPLLLFFQETILWMTLLVGCVLLVFLMIAVIDMFQQPKGRVPLSVALLGLLLSPAICGQPDFAFIGFYLVIVFGLLFAIVTIRFSLRRWFGLTLLILTTAALTLGTLVNLAVRLEVADRLTFDGHVYTVTLTQGPGDYRLSVYGCDGIGFVCSPIYGEDGAEESIPRAIDLSVDDESRTLQLQLAERDVIEIRLGEAEA